MGKILEKQRKFSDESHDAFLEEIKTLLEKAVELKNQGKEKESNEVMQEVKMWLDNKVEQFEEESKADALVPIERSVFPKFGEPIAEGEKICLGVLKEEEKEQYLAVKYEYSSMKGAYKNVEFREGTWKDFIEDNTFVCSIYEKKSNEYVGYCSIVNLAKKELELAIELKPDKCHKGYGSEALRLFMEEVCKVTGRQYFRVRVEIDNHASQGLMKKLGAYPNGISEFLLHGEEIEKFQAEHKDMITDEIRSVAAEFCMEAEDILGYVLEYRIDMEKM